MSREMLRDTINELIETEKTFVKNMEVFVKLINYSSSKNNSAHKEIEKALKPYVMLSEPNMLAELEPLKPDCTDRDITDMLNSINYALSPNSLASIQKNHAFNQAAENMVESLDLLQRHFVEKVQKQSGWQRIVNRSQKESPPVIFAKIYNSLKENGTLPNDAPGIDKIIFHLMIQCVQRVPRYKLLIDKIKNNADTLPIADQNTLQQTDKFIDELVNRVNKSAPAPKPMPSVSASAGASSATNTTSAPEPVANTSAATASPPPTDPPPPKPTKIAPVRTEAAPGVRLFDHPAPVEEAEDPKEIEKLMKILFALDHANMTLCTILKVPVPPAVKEVNDFCGQLKAEYPAPEPTNRKSPR